MCGIAGEIDTRPSRNTAEATYKAMRASLRPRGPDQEGIYQHGCATLLHTRLSVVDLEGGLQPMSQIYQEQKYTLCYNGELYNTEDIRRELLNYGHSFQGHSDTEVVLKSFIHWGEGCLSRFNGIFAFAIWLEKEEKLFLARDRMGVKPLFYHQEEGKFLFASEIKALLAHPAVKPQVSRESFGEMLLLGPGRASGSCVFTQIQELKPAYCGWFTREGFSYKPYWSLVDRQNPLSLEDTMAEIRRLVVDAVERQVLCDVPVCTFLSGGLDSSLITAIAAQSLAKEGEKLRSFSVDYRDNDQNFVPSHFQPSRDEYYINLVSQQYETIHENIILDTPQLVEALYRAVEARDLPGMADVDSSLLLFAQSVKEKATVALSGECADEIFGGYPWYRDPEIRSREGFPWAQNTEYRLDFLNKDFQEAINGKALVHEYYQNTIKNTHKQSKENTVDNRMKEMTRLNTDWFMQTLLERKDRMTMATGLEVRVPFCDYRIAELLYNVPWEWKDYQGYEKGILRKSMEGLLPEEVLWRKKSPYPKTMNPNYHQTVSRLLREILVSPTAPLMKFVEKSALENLLIDERSTPWYGQLMTTPQTIAYFVQMNHWLEHYQVELQ